MADTISMQHRIVELERQVDALTEALQAVLDQFEAGAFVRNIGSDGCSDWAIKAAAPLLTLGKARAALAAVRGEQP